MEWYHRGIHVRRLFYKTIVTMAMPLLGQGVKRIETMGTYQCRRVNNAKTGRWSEHANGEAIDIGGFTLDDGTRVMVEVQFNAQTREGELLRRVRDKACGLFSTTLSPDYNAPHYNALHYNHLHLDMGPHTICS